MHIYGIVDKITYIKDDREGIYMENNLNRKRDNYISWEEYFMAIAKLSAMRSKDPSTQVGACIVSNDNRILSIGIMDSKRF